MRLFFRVVMFSLIFSCIVGVASAAGYYREGDMGADVEAMQIRLKEIGFYKENVDGVYGEDTVKAVQFFQQARSLDPDGIVGVETYKMLMGRDIPVSRASVTLKIRKVIQESMQYLGVPYVFGGTSPNGFDCSGFTRYVFAATGIELPRMADAQYERGYPVAANRLQPGDMVFFETYEAGASHSGIYIGDGRFISATSSRGIAIDSLSSSYWQERYVGARRII